MKVGEIFWDGKPGAVKVADRVGNCCLLVADLPGGHSAWGDAEVPLAIPSMFLLIFSCAGGPVV